MTLLRVRRPAAALGVAALTLGLLVPLATPAAAQVQAQAVIVSANPENFTPNVLDGKVEAIAQLGNTVYAAGSFTQVQASSGGTVFTRQNIVAFDATNGAISTSFAPTVSGEIYDIELAADNQSIYVVGSFTTVNGTASSRLARLSLADGTKVGGFTVPTINGTVKNVDLVAGRLLLGGSFSTVGGQTRRSLASLDPASGALTTYLNLAVTGANAGGGTQVLKMAAAPNGSRLVVIGNFTSIAGQQRLQIAMIDLTQNLAVLTDWATGFYTNSCNPVFNTYMRDLDFSPDSSFFVVSTTGAYGGPTSPCDVITRWETAGNSAGQSATWRDYTGGDTTYAVAVTGAAVYVGGHMRWLNNPYAGDAQGPGGVPREGIAALDPVTGLPLSWNPGRDRGVGVFDMLATTTGLWVGSDTNQIGGETHRKIAFFPLLGGTALPAQLLGTLPNDVYLLGGTAATADPDVLYRVNAGGPAVQSADDGPDWAADPDGDSPYRNSGSNAADWGSTGAVGPTVPAAPTDRAPAALFATERWDPGSEAEMSWAFPVPANRQVTVRLYLSNRCDCTASAGQRVFDISVEGNVVANDLDLVSTFGNQVGGMISAPVTSDGMINIDFGHVVENPLINGIEIVVTGTQPNPGGGGSSADTVQRRYVTTSTVGATVTSAGTAAWSLDRGAFLIDSNLYTGWADGTFLRRTFNGTTFGAPTTIPLYGNSFGGEVANLTGIVYKQGRIYYTLFGQSELFWRWFSPQSSVVGAERNSVGGAVGELNPGRVQGMFLSGDDLYVADRSSGDLVRVGLVGTDVVGPVVTVDSANDWQARGMFLWNGTPAGGGMNVPPTAAATGSCPSEGLECTFGSASSVDPDGTIVTRSWVFSDGGSATGASPTHTFPAPGAYTATLTVTDNQGGSDSDTVSVTAVAPAPVPPVATFTQTCTFLSCTFDSTGSNDPDGGALTYAWDFGDGTSSTSANPTHPYATAGPYDVQLTVTDNETQTTSASHQVTVTAPTGSTIAFRDSAVANTNAVTTTIPRPAAAQANDVLLMFVTSNTGALPSSTTGGWQFVSSQLAGTDLRTALYQRAAGTGALGSVTFPAIAKTNVTVLAYSGALAAPSAAASAARTTAATSFATPGAAVASPGSWVVSFWALKASAVPVWTAPGGTTLRAASAGTSGGLVSGLAADAGPVGVGTSAGVSATSTVSSTKVTTWTVVLSPS